MTILLAAGWGFFAYSIRRRWKLMMVGVPDARFDQPGKRIGLTFKYALAQLRMQRYPLAGMAHMLIFTGFGVLLLRSLILWGRGYDESFSFWIFGPEQWLGQAYSFFKDVFAVLVILGTLVFVQKPRCLMMFNELSDKPSTVPAAIEPAGSQIK